MKHSELYYSNISVVETLATDSKHLKGTVKTFGRKYFALYLTHETF
jgi:hypothetical protein